MNTIRIVDSTSTSSSSKIRKNIVKVPTRSSIAKDDLEYDVPRDDLEHIEINKISTDRGSSTYTSLKHKREPTNVYQSLHLPGGTTNPPDTKEGDDDSVEYEVPDWI